AGPNNAESGIIILVHERPQVVLILQPAEAGQPVLGGWHNELRDLQSVYVSVRWGPLDDCRGAVPIGVDQAWQQVGDETDADHGDQQARQKQRAKLPSAQRQCYGSDQKKEAGKKGVMIPG